jgi:hypothetical protein
MCDRSCPGHTWGLRRIGVQVAGWNDFDAVVLPIHALHDNRFFIGRRARRETTGHCMADQAPPDCAADAPRRRRRPVCVSYTKPRPPGRPQESLSSFPGSRTDSCSAIRFRWRWGVPVEDVTRDACVGFSRSGISGSRKLSGNGIPRLTAASCTSWASLAHAAYRGRPKAYVLNEPNL